jgi:hypothetical protein
MNRDPEPQDPLQGTRTHPGIHGLEAVPPGSPPPDGSKPHERPHEELLHIPSDASADRGEALLGIVTKLKEFISILIVFLACAAPGLLLILQGIIIDFKPTYDAMGAKLPAPLALLADQPPAAIQAIWLAVPVILLLSFLLERLAVRVAEKPSETTGLTQLLATLLVALFLSFSVLELSFYVIYERQSHRATEVKRDVQD